MDTDINIENLLKKAVSEMLFLFILSKKDCYISEVMAIVGKLSNGVCNVTYPYAMIYRLESSHLIEESGKRIADDGRRRQFYSITEEGKEYLSQLVNIYSQFISGIDEVFKVGGINEI